MNEHASIGTPGAAKADGTVGKALALLDIVADAGHPMRFAEVQARVSYPKATLHRLLQTLVSQGMLTHDSERQTYALGMRLVRLAHVAWSQSSLAPLARPYVDALSAEVGQTIHLAQLSGGQVLYVDKRNAAKPVEMFSDAGKVGPGYCTGVGKAMLAFLPDEERRVAVQKQAFFKHTDATLDTPEALEAVLQEIRADGVSYDREEHEPGIICIAVPILSESRRVMGALSITGSTRDTSFDVLETYKPALQRTATEIARAAEAWQFPA